MLLDCVCVEYSTSSIRAQLYRQISLAVTSDWLDKTNAYFVIYYTVHLDDSAFYDKGMQREIKTMLLYCNTTLELEAPISMLHTRKSMKLMY